MIRSYLKMKKNEWKIKAQLYDIIVAFIDNQSEVVSLLKKLYEEFKDVSSDELKDLFVTKIIELSNEDK